MSKLRDDLLNVIATAKPGPADCVAVPVSVGALYAARMNVSEEDFIRMCRQAFGGALRARIAARTTKGRTRTSTRETAGTLWDVIKPRE